jgi:long-chain acyl-CoA synthetase
MEKVWLKSYESGVAPEINMKTYSSIRDILDQSFSKFANKGAFTNMGKTLTYGDLKEQSLKFASYLQNELGLKKGDRVALMMPNVLQYPIALLV